jgi:group I intron endonuclease
MQNTYNKYGAETFRYDVIEECAADVRIEREQHYIDTMEPVFNSCRVAGVTTGYKHSPEVRAKISAKAKTRGPRGPMSEEQKAKISVANKGRKRTPEFCAKVAERRRGQKASEETKAKMSAAHVNREPWTTESRTKLSASTKSHWAEFPRPPMSPEHRAKISAASKGKPHSAEHLAAIAAGRVRAKAERDSQPKSVEDH